MSIRSLVLSWAEDYTARRPPDFVVGDRQLERWWLIPRNRFLNLYLHRFNGSDEDRALHDHMYVNASWVLGPLSYCEVLFRERPRAGRTLPTTRVALRPPGKLVMRCPSTAHRIVLPSYDPVYSLFLTGPRVRQWGFWCPQGRWRHWREFVRDRDPGQVGRGCES